MGEIIPIATHPRYEHPTTEVPIAEVYDHTLPGEGEVEETSLTDGIEEPETTFFMRNRRTLVFMAGSAALAPIAGAEIGQESAVFSLGLSLGALYQVVKSEVHMRINRHSS